MKLTNKRIFAFTGAIALITAAVTLMVVFTRSSAVISRNISRVSEKNGTIVLSKATPFDWDKAYILEGPYMGGEQIDEITGVKCGLKRTEFEQIRRIVFIKDRTFVFDYQYSISKIYITPAGIVVDKNNCSFLSSIYFNGIKLTAIHDIP